MNNFRIISDEEFDKIRNLFWLEYSTYAGKDGTPVEADLLRDILISLNNYKILKDHEGSSK